MGGDFWGLLSISTVLLAASLWLIWWHWERLAAVESDEKLEGRERDHLRRRYRRRIQTSTLLGVVGVAILGGRLFPPDQARLANVIYWFCLTLLVLWMALLGVADIIATRLYFGRLRRNVEIQRTALEAQLRRAKPKREEARLAGQPKNEDARRDSPQDRLPP